METDKPDRDDSACLGTDDALPRRKAHRWLPSDESSRRASLISTLEGEIFPRLLMLYRSAGPAKTGAGADSPATDPDDVEELARVLLAHCPGTAHEFVEGARGRGVPYDRICLGLLIPAAYHLAERWECRELSDQEVTQGLSALHAMALEIGGAARSNCDVSRFDRSEALDTVITYCQ